MVGGIAAECRAKFFESGFPCRKIACIDRGRTRIAGHCRADIHNSRPGQAAPYESSEEYAGWGRWQRSQKQFADPSNQELEITTHPLRSLSGEVKGQSTTSIFITLGDDLFDDSRLLLSEPQPLRGIFVKRHSLLPHTEPFSIKSNSAFKTAKLEDAFHPDNNIEVPSAWIAESGPYKVAFDSRLSPFEPVPDGSSTLRLVPAKISAPSPRLMVSDTVSAAGPGGDIVYGEVIHLQNSNDSAPSALIKLEGNRNREPATVDAELSHLTGRLWRDKSGQVFRARQPELGERAAQKHDFVPDIVAVEQSKTSFVSGARHLSSEDLEYVRMNSDLIKLNKDENGSLLVALRSAPVLEFSDSPAVGWRTTPVFNPDGLTENCMVSTAALVRTLRSGKLHTATDIVNMKSIDGVSLDAPYNGRFRDDMEALDWFRRAAGVRLVFRTTDAAMLEPTKDYATVLHLGSNPSSSLKHMAFAHKFLDGGMVLYDSQTGVQWSEKFLRRRAAVPVTFHELGNAP